MVGAGPAGAATAYWLARAGHHVVAVEKKVFPREKTCGDGLTPRAVRQLLDMGLGRELEGHHRFDGLRATGHGLSLELPWPEHPTFPAHGYVVRRRDLDRFVAEHAVAAGAELHQGVEAVAPLREAGIVRGALVTEHATGRSLEVRAEHVVVAEGGNASRHWSLNSRENQLTPWSNDPVTDRPGEVLYIKDEETGKIWGPDSPACPG